ncbi:MAG: hypothetical protein ABIO70_21855 [Pseudomonadota bacterium]
MSAGRRYASSGVLEATDIHPSWWWRERSTTAACTRCPRDRRRPRRDTPRAHVPGPRPAGPARPWDWAEIVDRDWDEFLNPSRYTEGAQRGIDRWLADHDEQLCALDRAGRAGPPARVPPEEYLVLDALVAQDGRLPPGYDGRSDAFRRAERCAEAGE